MAFIMITLAFAQMFYFLAISLKQFGGDDGLTIAARSDFGLFSLPDNVALYYCTFVVLIAVPVRVYRVSSIRASAWCCAAAAATSGAWRRSAFRCCATSSPPT